MESTALAAFLGVAGMVACVLCVVKPLWPKDGMHRQNWRASTVWSDWLDQKQTILFNLEDLAHEQKLGKLSDEDFTRLETTYKKQMLALMDQMQNSRPPADFEAFMLGAKVRGEIASPQKAARNDGARVCFACKTFYDQAFKFCPQCGGTLTVQS